MVLVVFLAVGLVSIGAMAEGKPRGGSELTQEVSFALDKSYELTILEGSDLSYSFQVTRSTARGFFHSTPLHLKLEHNYDVRLQFVCTSFLREEGEEEIPAYWTIDWAQSSKPPDNWDRSSTVGTDNTTRVEQHVPARVTPGKDLWLRVLVRAKRSGLSDPAGIYRATIDVKVVELTS